MEFLFQDYFGEVQTLQFNNARQAEIYAQQTGLTFIGQVCEVYA